MGSGIAGCGNLSRCRVKLGQLCELTEAGKVGGSRAVSHQKGVLLKVFVQAVEKSFITVFNYRGRGVIGANDVKPGNLPI